MTVGRPRARPGPAMLAGIVLLATGLHLKEQGIRNQQERTPPTSQALTVQFKEPSA